jgi:hypothetical protein
MPLVMDSSEMVDISMADVDIPGAAMLDPMDDLFGEAANDMSVHVQLPITLPPPPKLADRLAEMQASVCCT